MTRPRIPINSNGTINLKELEPGKWRARTYYRYPDGKLKQIEVMGVSRPKAEAALKAKISKLRNRHIGAISPDMPLRNLAAKYEEVKRGSSRPRTMDTYRTNLRIVKRYMGELTIAEATPDVIQPIMNRIRNDHGHGSAKGVRSVLSGMFSLAVRNGALTHNPVSELENIRKGGKIGSDPIPLDMLEEFYRLVEANEAFVRNDEVDLIRFMCGTGLRGGEALGLCWDKVDFRQDAISVECQSQRISGEGMKLVAYTKTDKGIRKIHVSKSIMALLERRRETMTPNVHNLVFPTPLGRIGDIGTFGRHLREQRKTLGMEGLRITSHSFRKTCASILHSQGMGDLDVSDYIGDNDVKVTQTVYIQRSTKSLDAARMLDAFNDSHPMLWAAIESTE